jgi:hypothetical protein
MRFDIGLGMLSKGGSGYQESILSLLTTTTTYLFNLAERRHRDGGDRGTSVVGEFGTGDERCRK